jgi:hypothetical protein
VFDVRSLSPLDDRWEARDAELTVAAGCRSNSSGTEGRFREHVWLMATLNQARRLRKYLLAVPGVMQVTIREHTSEGGLD